MYEILFYEDEKGRSPDEFLDGMQPKTRAKVEKEGPNLPRPFADVVKGKIRELRVGFGSNYYRFLYFFFGKKIIITHGFLKKTAKIPPREIAKAERMMQDFLQRYQGGEIKI